ncbi:MAG: hypothetical protein H7067_17200 [Burkholderiales bacterium]|nr:hypothetical protein [Opitutaceae bacterium]
MFGIVAAGLAATVLVRAETLTLVAGADSTIFSESGSDANGQGDSVFAGTTRNGDIRRALLWFDVAAALPAGATVDSVTLGVRVSRSNASNKAFALHLALSDWGEGPSVGGGGAGVAALPGDSTWTHAFLPGVTWTTAGGDFASTASATAVFAGNFPEFNLFTGGTLAADVQGWLAAPGENHGWFLRGDEVGTQTAYRFDSSESATVAFRPTLTIQYTPIPEPSAYAVAAGVAALGGVLVARRRR